MAIPDMQPVMGSMDDAAVIADSRRRPEAFRVLFDRHYERVRRYAWARIGPAGDDVAAEVFAIAFAGRDRYDLARPDALPWLLGIATNLIRRQHREEQRRLRLLAALGSERPPVTRAEGNRSGGGGRAGRAAPARSRRARAVRRRRAVLRGDRPGAGHRRGNRPLPAAPRAPSSQGVMSR